MKKENLETRIINAKVAARLHYIRECVRSGTWSPEVKREWEKIETNDGTVLFGLSGSPYKAFVVVDTDYSVKACRADGTIIEVF